MTSLTLQFNQLVDLAVNPALGTVNTILLHNLLHVVVDQLGLSTSFVEFHGAGSAAIESTIVNSERHCGFEISKYDVKKEVDEATGANIEKRILNLNDENDRNVKVFAITNVAANKKCPTGFPLQPMQVISVDEFRNLQTSSIHDFLSKVLPEDKFFESERPESSFKAMLDFINLSKRLDALEIGTRQLAEVIRRSQCDFDSKCEGIGPELLQLEEKIDSLWDKVNKLKCKCNEENFEENLFVNIQAKINQELEERLTKFQTDLDNFKNFQEITLKDHHQEMKVFVDLVCERLDFYKNDFVKGMTEIQAMMDSKLDKFFVPELKNYLNEKIQNLEEKIDKLDFNKALAAGVAKKIFTNLNCISCSEKVIQADARHPANAMLKTNISDKPQLDSTNEIQLLKLPTRLCGGKHTITTAKERIFKSETVKLLCK